MVAILYMGFITAVIGGGRPMPPGNIGDNIALNKPYTLSPAPNYSYCTDAGDVTQLTDGQSWTGGSFWTRTSTVGWNVPSSNPAIIIDLGQAYPIKGISFNTAGGVAGVYWPNAINLSVSNDGINYYSAGELTGISNSEHGDAPAYGTYQVHRYYTNSLLSTHGRYVKIEVVRQGQYVFVDEVEIYRGANSLLGQNVAINKSYTMSPPPNYSGGCTDTGDATQLTDGAYTSGYFWTQPPTVGWMWLSGITIVIDLGQNQPIEGLSFNTAGGCAGVTWPTMISILVSDNGVDYYNAAGDLVTLSSEHGLPPPSGYLVRSYWSDRLATHGRYVKIMPAGGTFIFVDEIEVYQGNSGMLTQPSRGAIITDMVNYAKVNQIRIKSSQRITADANDVQAQANAQTGLTQAVRDQIKSLLDTSIIEALNLPDSNPATFQTILPLNYPANITHARVFRALSKLWQAQGKTGLIAWQTSSPWDPLDITQAPQTGSNPEINARMLQNEYRAAAFNLSNASDNDLTVSLNIEGLPGGTNPACITVHEVAWTDTKEGNPIASALPVNGLNINIPSGMTRQVWLTFHPTIINPGTYNGTIVANGGAAGTVNIPVTFQLSCLGFSAQPALSLGGFDYTDRDTYDGMTLQNRDAFITHLREHFVDTTWGTSTAMPNPPSFTNFDAWAARWSGIRNYRIFLNFGNTFNGYLMGTPEFNAAVAGWINAYAVHWQGMGLNLNQIVLHIFDEPMNADKANTVTLWANAIHAAQPDIKIWNDPLFSDPSVSYAQSMFQAVDILCPNRPIFIAADEAYRDIFRTQVSAGKTLNFYSCFGPASQLDPYSYYRLQAWACLKESATAMYYWAFSSKSSWNEYDVYSYLYYGPFFLGNTTVTAGKPMEAIREGVEDYEYLVMLKKRLAELDPPDNNPAYQAARTLRDSAADAVLNATGAGQLNWADTKNRGIADQKRIEILEMLEALGPQTGGNIAKGKTYTLSSAPNYPYCTDAGDTTQLTDGNTYTGGGFWTQSSTVGWLGTNTVTILIDLGSVQPIQGVSYNTAGGGAGVQWPVAIDMSVSNDGINYSNIGELVSISNTEHGNTPPASPYAVHRYWTKSLPPVNGRFVKIAVTESPFIFVDEIEVYRN